MLVLSRKRQESIRISDEIVVTVLAVSAQELAPIKAQIEEQKQLFDKLHRELQQVVKDDPQLNKSWKQ